MRKVCGVRIVMGSWDKRSTLKEHLEICKFICSFMEYYKAICLALRCDMALHKFTCTGISQSMIMSYDRKIHRSCQY